MARDAKRIIPMDRIASDILILRSHAEPKWRCLYLDEFNHHRVPTELPARAIERAGRQTTPGIVESVNVGREATLTTGLATAGHLAARTGGGDFRRRAGATGGRRDGGGRYLPSIGARARLGHRRAGLYAAIRQPHHTWCRWQ